MTIVSSIICTILSHSHGLTPSLPSSNPTPQDDEENLGLLFWDDLPPGDGGVGGAGLSRENAGGPEEDNEIPVINPSDQSAEYTSEMFGMHQNDILGTNSYVAGNPPLCEQLGDSGGGVRRTSLGSTFVNLIAKPIPNAALQSRDENTPCGGDAVGYVAPPTYNTMGGAAAVAAPTTIRGAELSAFFPSPSCGSVPPLLEVQEVQQQHQTLGIASLGYSALKVADAVTGGGVEGGLTNSSSIMLPSSLTASNGNDGQSFLQAPNVNPTNVNDQWAKQLTQHQLSSSMNSLPLQLPSAAVNQPLLGAVDPTSPNPYLMWLLQQQQQAQQAQAHQQANVVPQVQALPSNTNSGGAAAASSSSAAHITLRQLQLLQLLQLQQQQVQTAASQQQQQQSNLLQASSEQLQSLQSQLHLQNSVNAAMANSGATQGWLENPLPQQPKLKSYAPSVKAATLQSKVSVKDGRRTRAVVSAKDSNKRKSE